MKSANERATVAVVGAGNVGATLAMRIFESGLADVAMIDLYGAVAKGKALDILDTSGVNGVNSSITGTDNLEAVKDASIVVITAGIPRKPGMSRDDLIAKNASVIKDVSSAIKAHAPRAIVIVVTNPLDAMTYLSYRTCAFPRGRVMGMAGVLDESRFITLISRAAHVSPSDVQTVMMGSHGDTMVPVLSHTFIKGKPVAESLSQKTIDEVVLLTRGRGAEVVNLLGSGSAYYSPSRAAFAMVETIIGGKEKRCTAAAYLDGEYGLKDICIGVPVVLGKNGIESVTEIKLTATESAALQASAESIRGVIALLPKN